MRFLWLDLLQSHFLCDVVKLFAAYFFQLFAARFELFVDLDGFLRHVVMRFLRAADEREVRPRGDTLVAVGIQADAEDGGDAFLLFGVGHEVRLKPGHEWVKNGRNQFNQF
jgi:hypothetical protein